MCSDFVLIRIKDRAEWCKGTGLHGTPHRNKYEVLIAAYMQRKRKRDRETEKDALLRDKERDRQTKHRETENRKVRERGILTDKKTEKQKYR